MLEPLQILISLSGVSAILFLVWLTTRRVPALRLGGEAGVRERLAHELPGFDVGKVAVGTDDRRALVLSSDGSDVVLVFAMGGRATCWRFSRDKLGKVSLRDAGSGAVRAELSTHDFTRPKFALTFERADLVPAELR